MKTVVSAQDFEIWCAVQRAVEALGTSNRSECAELAQLAQNVMEHEFHELVRPLFRRLYVIRKQAEWHAGDAAFSPEVRDMFMQARGELSVGNFTAALHYFNKAIITSTPAGMTPVLA